MTSAPRVDGMTCGGCVKFLTRALNAPLSGVEVRVQLDGGLVQLAGTHEAGHVADAVDAAGVDFGGAVGA